MKKIFLSSILLVVVLVANAQCNKKLIEEVKSKLEEGEVYITDFKIKLGEANVDDPAPVAKFSQKLENGKMYRLRIVSDTDEYNSIGILRLFENNNFLGTTYIEKNDRHYDFFHFKCKKTGNYKLLITFKDGKAGCAVVIVSEVEN